MEEDVQVVEVPEVLLEAAQRLGERGVVFGVDRRREIGHLTKASDPDPKPVQAVHGRPTAGLSVRRGDLLPTAALMIDEDASEVRTCERARAELEGFPNVVEEPRLALGAKECSQKLPPGPCILFEAGAVLAELLVRLLRAGVGVRPFEQSYRHVAVPHLADEPRETLDPCLQRPELGLADLAEKLPPDRERSAESSHRPVQSMEASRGRTRATDHVVYVPHHLGQDPAQLGAEPLRIEGQGRSVALHVRPPSEGTPVPW